MFNIHYELLKRYTKRTVTEVSKNSFEFTFSRRCSVKRPIIVDMYVVYRSFKAISSRDFLFSHVGHIILVTLQLLSLLPLKLAAVMNVPLRVSLQVKKVRNVRLLVISCSMFPCSKSYSNFTIFR